MRPLNKTRTSSTMRSSAVVAALLLSACATPGVGSSAPSGQTSAPSTGAQTGGASRTPWRVTTDEHVDLWLHGFALLTSDTGHVPFFARGYKQEVQGIKRQKNLLTQLDANQQQLSQRFVSNPGLTNAQFLAMYFPSFQEIVNAEPALPPGPHHRPRR